MFGSVVVFMVILLYVFTRIITNISVFGLKTHNLFNEMKKILIAQEYGRTDRFDDVRDFIKSKNLSDDDLSKLITFIKIKREQLTHAFNINIVMITVIIALVTILAGTTFNTTLGGLFGTFADKLYEEPEVAQLIYSDMRKFVDKANFTILTICIGGIFGLGTWGIRMRYLSEITLGALRVVEQEQEERTKK